VKPSRLGVAAPRGDGDLCKCWRPGSWGPEGLSRRPPERLRPGGAAVRPPGLGCRPTREDSSTERTSRRWSRHTPSSHRLPGGAPGRSVVPSGSRRLRSSSWPGPRRRNAGVKDTAALAAYLAAAPWPRRSSERGQVGESTSRPGRAWAAEDAAASAATAALYVRLRSPGVAGSKFSPERGRVFEARGRRSGWWLPFLLLPDPAGRPWGIAASLASLRAAARRSLRRLGGKDLQGAKRHPVWSQTGRGKTEGRARCGARAERSPTNGGRARAKGDAEGEAGGKGNGGSTPHDGTPTASGRRAGSARRGRRFREELLQRRFISAYDRATSESRSRTGSRRGSTARFVVLLL